MNDADTRMMTLFHAALERASPEERDAFLEAACGADAELRKRVKALLRAHEQAGGFLPEEPATAERKATVPAPPPTERPGVTLAGRYKLLEQLGEGGMGSVWMARQLEPVKRTVAVKLIKAGMDSKAVLARFEAERQALALMDHPNIAKVHDAGTTPDGRPFFVMELVKGVPITKFCDEHRLTPRQRLALFVHVCQAIQHAHQKGIIHRDVKPSNVLVALYDDRPVPKVIDFGIAKATGPALTDRTMHTGFGAVVGTVEYMSPEQAGFNQLDVDTRSDVYSLGVLLYELLAGSPPFSRKELEKAGVLEMLRVIREDEPSRPSTKLSTAKRLPRLAANRGTEPKRLAAVVRGELDWIVMKALEKERNRRYETANGLAMDVQRYLKDEAVQACPPSATYRLGKLLRRNKGPVLAATGLLALLLVTLALVLYSKSRVDRALADRTSAFHQLEDEQKKTDENRRAAEQKAEEIRDGLEKLNASNVQLERGRACMDSPHHDFMLRSGPARAAEALDRAVALRPDHSLARDGRGLFLCRLGLFGEAAPDLDRAYALRSMADVKLDGSSYDLWFRYACLRAWTGDLAGYREVCARMAEHLARSTDRGCTDYWAARTCDLAPQALADPGQVVRMAQAGAAWQPRAKYSLFALGMAHYRAGQFAEAVRRLKEADAATIPWEPEGIIWLGLALGHHRLSDPAAAGQALARADRWLDAMIGAPENKLGLALPVPWWEDWAGLQMLYREAAGAVRGPTKADHAAFHLVQAKSYAAIGRGALAAEALARADRLRPHDPVIEAAEQPLVVSADPRQCRLDAEFLIHCVVLTEGDAGLSVAQRRKNAQGYASQAKTVIEEARKKLAAAKPKAADPRKDKANQGLAAEYQALADLSLTLGDAAGARESTRAALELMPDDLGPLYNHVAVLLLAGDGDEAARLSRLALQRFGAKYPYSTIRVCTLPPDPGADLAQLVAVAQKSVESNPHAPELNKLGIAHYRARQYDPAIQRLEESLKAGKDWEARACNWLVLAMAQHELGHPDLARRSLGEAERWIEKASAEGPRESLGPFAGTNRAAWLVIRVLHREARTVIGAKPPAPPAPKPK